jgi:NADPH:quinone reductase-like Zn-dependent oxidoreductase
MNAAQEVSPRPAAAPAPGERMRAIVQDRYGTSDVLRLADVAVPEVGPTDVLVEVHAAGVDRGVWHLMTGLPYVVRLAGYGLRRPKTPVPGLDVAGRVVAVGPRVTRVRPGDEVLGIARGAFAEYAVADEDKLVRKPAGLGFAQAAAMPVSGITALQALTDVGRVERGQKVLVLGASGGVGTYAVQIAAALGAEVTGIASAAKADLVRSLGAGRVLDYATEDALDGHDRYDLIVDIGGRNRLSRLRRALERRGTLVIVGGEGGGRWTGGAGRQLRAVALSPFVGPRLTTFVSKEHHEPMERLVALVDAGDVTPVVDRVRPLEEVPAAIDDLVSGRVGGKTVIAVRPG